MKSRRYVDPNLARDPFENTRPVERLALALWALVLVAGSAAFWLSLSARTDAASRELELARVTSATVAAREHAAHDHEALEKANIVARNLRTEFLNQRIAERAFSWNELFTSLGEVLPRGVRLQELSPQGFASKSTGTRVSAASPATTLVALKIDGVAEDTESLLAFVDALYGHPAFSEPNLTREATQKSEEIDFNLSVGYRPGIGHATAGDARVAAGAAARAPAAGVRPGAVSGVAPAQGGIQTAPQTAGSAVPGAGNAGAATASAAAAAPFGAAPVAVAPSRPLPGGTAAQNMRRGVGTGNFQRESTPYPVDANDAKPYPEDGSVDATGRETAGRRPQPGQPTDPNRPNVPRQGVPGVPVAPVLPAPLRPFASAPGDIR